MSRRFLLRIRHVLAVWQCPFMRTEQKRRHPPKSEKQQVAVRLESLGAPPQYSQRS